MSSDPRSSERQSPTVGTYVCSFCNHPSVSLAAIRDHLESSHKDKVFTDEDFISSVIYKPHSLSIKPSSNSSESAQVSPSSIDSKKKSSVTIRCKLCCESFLEGKEYLRHLKSCRAAVSVANTTVASTTKAAPKGRPTRSGTTRGRGRGGKVNKVLPTVETKVKRGPKKTRGRGGASTVSAAEHAGRTVKREKISSKPSNAITSSSSLVRSAPSPKGASSGGDSRVTPPGSSRSGMTTQFHSTLSGSDSPLPYCALCDKQFSMQTTYQIHLESKDHKAQDQIKREKDKRRNRMYACSLCPEEGPWIHKRHLRQHMQTNQHKMAKKVEAMVSKIFTDQPIDDNLEDLKEEQRQLAEVVKGGEASKEGVDTIAAKVDSEEDSVTTSSSSIPSPSAVVIRCNEDTSTASSSPSRGGGGVKVEHRSPAELDALVKKMLEPAKKYFIPPPPSQRPPEYTPSGLRDTTGFVVLNDMPNRLLPCNIDLSKPLDHLVSVPGDRPRDRQMEVWEEAVSLVRKLASYSSLLPPTSQEQHNRQL